MQRITFKLLCFIVFVNLSQIVLGQAPNKFSYQAVIRNDQNKLVVDKVISMRISIIAGDVTGITVYQETHTSKTNSNGLISLIIGTGTQEIGNFDSIHWGNNDHFIKLETDLNGGSNFNIIGTTQLLSVPYALYAENSKNPGPKGDKGDRGEIGETGKQGEKGDTGVTGKDGIGIVNAKIKTDSLFLELTDSTTINTGKVIYSSQDKIHLFVEDFGAKPNDSNFDNSLSIQNAIDSAMKSGKILYFKKGIYYIKKNRLHKKILENRT